MGKIMIDLKEILNKHPEAAGDSRQMMGLLQDYYPDYENEYEKRIILFFMECGIVDDLRRKKQHNEIITAADEKKYLQKLKNQYGTTEEFSGSIFRLWVDALELEIENSDRPERSDDENNAEKPPSVPQDQYIPQDQRVQDRTADELIKIQDAQKEHLYQSALHMMASADREGCFGALRLFQQIPGYKDADRLSEECRKKLKPGIGKKILIFLIIAVVIGAAVSLFAWISVKLGMM